MSKTQQSIATHAADDTSIEALRLSFLNHLTRTVGRLLDVSTDTERYHALAHVVRDLLMDDWIKTIQSYRERDVRVVCYLSAEFLLGPHLMNGLLNLGITQNCAEALDSLGVSLKSLAESEPEPGLGNGGLGRLAACYMDSMATLGVPAIGYGLRYEFGIFRQEIRDGWQVERSDKWLQFGNPWEVPVSDASVTVQFGGRTESYKDEEGILRCNWIAGNKVMGVPYDTPIPGFRNGIVNRLRLWKAESVESFDFAAFNTGDYIGAVRDKMESETISKVLYPNDETDGGKRLRLMQQYFFTSCSLQDMLRLHLLQKPTVRDFDSKWTVQLNDTHPSIGIAELMRLLIDVHGLPWDDAWKITGNTFGYTNHTLLPEALERWPLHIFGELLPRLLEIIYEINAQFLRAVEQRFPYDKPRLARMSIIGEEGDKTVRMAHLAVVGSKAVNGVAKLHSDLLIQGTLKDFYELFPERFSNKTNGVTPRRWLMLSNPPLAKLLDDSIGQGWHTDLTQLSNLEAFTTDAGFLDQWRKRQIEGKAALAAYIWQTMDITVDPTSMFDVQVKRIHEYKRQHLCALHILALYVQIKAGTVENVTPRTFIFGGKAAPGYRMAKLMIKLICTVAELVNNDPVAGKLIRVVFIPDYSVSLGQRIYPAADLSEQVSTAGKEASGTGCMKFMMNGAVAIGTLDGANIEIRDAVGKENFFLFGLTAPEVDQMKADGYRSRKFYESDPLLREVLDGLGSGAFSKGDWELFRPLLDELLNKDTYMLLADFQSYIQTQADAGTAFKNATAWSRMSILNTARSGIFSSDRAIAQYCADIWKVPHRVEAKGAPYNQETMTPPAILNPELVQSELIQIDLAPRKPAPKPAWLKAKSPMGETFHNLKKLARELNLHTVCESAQCPNIGECWNQKSATFMMLGNLCTRRCGFCAVPKGRPGPIDHDEPRRVAYAVAQLGLAHAVITSVNRDDDNLGAAEAFVSVIREIRGQAPGCRVEVLTPDFQGGEEALRLVVAARPEILNHNIETVPRLYRVAKSGGRYERSLRFLEHAKEIAAETGHAQVTKTGIIVGMGEEMHELLAVFRDLAVRKVDILTIGQYLRPSRDHLPMARFYSPDEFAFLKHEALGMGFRHVESGPLVRSSYHAQEQAEATGLA